MKKSLGLYIHIPFCLKKCGYCDFCSFPGASEEYRRRYADEIYRRLDAAAARAEEYEVDTVYFGGGTPSLLPTDSIGRIMERIFGGFSVASDAEITLECNPATASPEYLSRLRRMGVNRLSIGLQSAIDSELALLGRVHTAEDFVRTFKDARTVGFDNISADLMYGIPDQTGESFERTLELLTSLQPEHISAYGLMIEPGTELERKIDTLCVADDDGQYELYIRCSDYLRSCGYNKYEISNFAKGGKRSRHNMRYWLGEEYLGFGVAAHSYFGGRRFGNSRDIDAFMRGEDITDDSVLLDEADIREEFIMLRLRLADGICISEYNRRFGRDFWRDMPKVRSWISDGFMHEHDGEVSFTDKGFFVSNTIISEMLDFE